MGALVSATQQLAQHQPTPPVTPDDAAAVRDVSTRILQRSLQQQQNNLASLVLDGHVDALLALTATLQQLAPPTAAA
jgi:predicted ATP-dependent Lon-type protease